MVVKPGGIGGHTVVGIRRDLGAKTVQQVVKPTLTDSRVIRPAINGSAQRKSISWIESFVKHSDNLEAPEIFRRWSAITAIAAALEQKVWMTTSTVMYPNLYTFLIARPGVGKSRTINTARGFLAELTELHIAPTSMTMASLVDCLMESKRMVINLPKPPLEFNSMVLLPDEWGAFMHQYDDEMISGLTTFYDVVIPYSQHRRSKDIKIKIKAPQLSILAGTTPANLIKFMPEVAWDHGLTSRMIFIYADYRPMNDDMFAVPIKTLPPDMVYDIKAIHSLQGEFKTTPEYEAAMNNWRKLGEKPVPNHPRLTHYCTRRLAHLMKLTMIASADRGDDLVLRVEDFNRAMGWLLQAEETMGDIFRAGSVGIEAKTMDEVYHFIQVADKGQGVHESKIIRFVSERIPSHSVLRLLEIMERSERIKVKAVDPKTGMRLFSAL